MTATPGGAGQPPETGPDVAPTVPVAPAVPTAPAGRGEPTGPAGPDESTGPADGEPETVELALPAARSATEDEIVTEQVRLPEAANPPTVATPMASTVPSEAGTSTEVGTSIEVGTSTEAGTALGGGSAPVLVAPAESAAPAHRAPRTVFGRSWWIKVTIVGLCALLGLSLAAQLRRNEKSDAELSSARQQDLVRILDELDSREQRLRLEINQLEERQRNLGTAAAGSQTVLTDLQQREQELGILAGTLPAEGTGVKLVFRGGRGALPADVILNAVEELRGAGAEALQIVGSTGAPVRIVASTSFLDDDNNGDDGDLLIGDRRLSAPYTLLAIGDGQTMRAALAIPGGVVDSVRDAGGTVLITTPDSVSVTATRQPTTPKYATPVD